MKELSIKEALLEVGTCSTFKSEWMVQSKPIAIALFKGRIVAVEWQHESNVRFWDNENIVSVSTIIEIK